MRGAVMVRNALVAFLVAIAFALAIGVHPVRADASPEDSLESYELMNNDIAYLRPDNIESKIATGNWIVFFGSSRCPHCRSFTPVWHAAQKYLDEEVLKRTPAKTSNDEPIGGEKGSGIGIGGDPTLLAMAKVECASRPENEDVCASYNVGMWPTVLGFIDGKSVGEYEDFRIFRKSNKGPLDLERSISNMKRFISDTIKNKAMPLPGAEKDKSNDETKATDDDKTNADTDKKPADTDKKADAKPNEKPGEKLKFFADEESKVPKKEEPKAPKKEEAVKPTEPEKGGQDEVDAAVKTIMAKLSDIATERAAPKAGVNVKGVVTVLTTKNFDELTQNGPWLIEFYAPWCPHCSKFAPVYEKAASLLRGIINVGKIDGTTEPDLMKRFKVAGYPTLKYYNVGTSLPGSGADDKKTKPDIVDYHDMWTDSDLVAFAKYFTTKPPFSTAMLDDITKVLGKDETVLVLYVGGDQIESKDGGKYVAPTFGADLEEIVRQVGVVYSANKLPARLFVTPDPRAYGFLASKWTEIKTLPDTISSSKAVLVSIKDNGQTVVPYLDRFKDSSSLQLFLKHNSRDRVIELDHSTQHDVMESDSVVVLYAMDKLDPDYATLMKNYREAAIVHWKYLKQPFFSAQVYEDSIFCWIDGIKYEKYLSRVFNIHERNLPKLIIAIPSKDLYYETALDGEPLSTDNVVKSLLELKDLTPRKTVGFVGSVVNTVFDMFLGFVNFFGKFFLIVAVLVAVVGCCACMRWRKRGYQSVGQGPRAGRFMSTQDTEVGVSGSFTQGATTIFDRGLFVGAPQKAD